MVGKVLITAHALVPGANPHTAAVVDLTVSLRADFDIISLKSDSLGHVERWGVGRMFRVPVGEGPAEAQRHAFARAVMRQLQAEPYAVVHVLGAYEAALVADMKAGAGCALVYQPVSYPDPESHGEWLAHHQAAMRAADRVIVPSWAAEASALEAGANPSSVRVIAPTVDVSAFDWESVERTGPKRALFVGHLGPDRDLETLVEALRRLRTTTSLRVLFVGDPDRTRRDALSAKLAEAELTDVARVLGTLKHGELADLIASADVGLVTAGRSERYSSFGDVPHPLLEFAAARTAFVAPQIPGVASLLRSAITYAPGDTDSLTTAIEEALRSGPAALEKVYDEVRHEHTPGRRRRAYRELYRDLCGVSPDPWTLESSDEVDDLTPSAIRAAEAALNADSSSPGNDGRGELASDVTAVSLLEPAPTPMLTPPLEPDETRP